MAYEAYEAFRNVKPSTRKAYYQKSMEQFLSAEFENCSNYYTVEHEDRATQVFEEVGVRLTKPYNMTRALTLNDDFLQVTFKEFDYEVNLGDYFNIDGYRWMVVNMDVVQTGARSCIVQRCNVLLKFIDSTNSVYPTVSDDVISIYGIAENKLYQPLTNNYIHLPNEELQVKVQANSDSQSIKSENKGTRFILGNPVKGFETVGIDSISQRRELVAGSAVDDGIIALRLKFSQLNSRVDNISERVAKQYA